MFDEKSRYSAPDLKDETFVRSDGRLLTYRSLRTVPRPDERAAYAEIESRVGERPDQVATRAFGEPELAWRLFDANVVFDPLSLPAIPGRLWRVPNL